jgi:hypothetical protein
MRILRFRIRFRIPNTGLERLALNTCSQVFLFYRRLGAENLQTAVVPMWVVYQFLGTDSFLCFYVVIATIFLILAARSYYCPSNQNKVYKLTLRRIEVKRKPNMSHLQ